LTHDFTDTTLVTDKWYKLTRTVTECGNSCSSSYILYKESQNCIIPNNGVELRTVINNSQSNDYDIRQIEIENDYDIRQIEIETSDLQIFPNPSSGIINVVDRFKDEFRDVSLYNSIGSKVFSKNYNSNNYKLDFTDFTNGVYMLVITTETGVQKQQIIKE
jgi:hypothetical protein